MRKSHAICVGKVWHKRYSPKLHEFSYSLNSWWIDLQDVNSIKCNSWLVNTKLWALYRFSSRRYLRDSVLEQPDLLVRVKTKFMQHGVQLNGKEQFYLLGQLTNLGAYFSPLNFYFCYHDQEARYLLAEVSNTPWNERHYYLIDLHDLQSSTVKSFHVSPFFKMGLYYQWDFELIRDKISYKIDSYSEDELVFTAAYSGSLQSIDQLQAKITILKSPCTVYKILFGIYCEALFLFLKKVPFISYKK